LLECKFKYFYLAPSIGTVHHTAASQNLLKFINVSRFLYQVYIMYIAVFILYHVICIQILYTNKAVRLYYMAPTMRNGSETVIRNDRSAFPEESIS
jgi:hypothetical protein